MKGWMRSAAAGAVMIVSGAMHAGAGEPQFAAHTFSTAPYSDLAATDLDKDGDAEMVAVKAEQFIVWYDHVGPGPFDIVEHIAYERPSSAIYMLQCRVTDVNGDGWDDIVVPYGDLFDHNGDGAFWLRHRGDDPPTFERVEIGIHELTALAWAFDADDDGDVDVLTLSAGDFILRLWENLDGEGADWSWSVLLEDATEGENSFKPDDWDGDGDTDIIYCQAFEEKFRILERDSATGVFLPPRDLIVLPGSQFINGYNFEYVDLDQDGHLDIVPWYISSSAYWWRREGDTYNDVPFGTGQRLGRVVVDLDHDGMPDVVGSGSAVAGQPDRMFWQRNNGSVSTWTWVNEEVSGESLWTLASGDFDGDGDTDLFAIRIPNQDGLAWIENRINEPSQNLPGDLTGDCVVGFSDLNIVVGTFGQSGAGVLGDADGDQVVGFSDLNIVLVQFGQSCE